MEEDEKKIDQLHRDYYKIVLTMGFASIVPFAGSIFLGAIVYGHNESRPLPTQLFLSLAIGALHFIASWALGSLWP